MFFFDPFSFRPSLGLKARLAAGGLIASGEGTGDVVGGVERVRTRPNSVARKLSSAQLVGLRVKFGRST